MKELTEVLKDWEAVIGLEIPPPSSPRSKPRCSAAASSAMTTRRTPTYSRCAWGFPARSRSPTRAPSRASSKRVRPPTARSKSARCSIASIISIRHGQELPDHAGACGVLHARASGLQGHGPRRRRAPRLRIWRRPGREPGEREATAEGLSRQMVEELPETGGRGPCGDGRLRRRDLAVAERHDDGSYTVPIRILRIHLEEDAAKMVHVGGEEGRMARGPRVAPRLRPLRHPAHRVGHRARPAQPGGGAALRRGPAPRRARARHLGLLPGVRLHAL